MAQEESEKHIKRRWSIPTQFGRAHFIDFDVFDPQLFLENTPLGSDTEKYHSRTTTGGVSIVYSRMKPDPATELLMLSVSGGTPEAQRAIVREFSGYLGRSTDRMDWVSVSPLGISPVRDMYIWKVDLGKTQ